MGKFTEMLTTAAGGLLGSAGGGLMGMAFAGANDRRQREMEEWLQRLQIQGQKEMTDYNMLKQLEMWEKTGYGPQMDQLKKAGLNPALLYGMAGGGGQSNSVTPGNIGKGTAPTGGGEAIAGMGMGMNLQLMKAQKDLLEAQARNLNVDAKKKETVDTENVGQQTLNLKTQNELDKFRMKINNATETEQKDMVKRQWELLVENIAAASTQNDITTATKDTQIETAKAQLAQIYVDNALKGTANEKAKQETLLMWEQLKNEKDKTKVQQKMAEFETSYGKQAINVLQTLIGLKRPM